MNGCYELTWTEWNGVHVDFIEYCPIDLQDVLFTSDGGVVVLSNGDYVTLSV